MTSLRRVRVQLRDMRAYIAPGRPQRLIAVSSAVEADDVQSRLAPGGDALIVVTGVPRAVRKESDSVNVR